MTRAFTIAAILIVVAATVAGGLYTRSTKRRAAASANVSGAPSAEDKYEADKVETDYSEAIETVEQNYAGDIDYEKATQAAIQGMLFTLDPHSVYFSSDEFKKLKEDQASSFYGIGVQILRHDDGVYVQSVVENTPASRAGLRYGDRIVEVDGKDARDWSSDQVSKNVRGDRGHEVQIKVERAGQQVAQTFRIIRDAVPLPPIRNAFMITSGNRLCRPLLWFSAFQQIELREAIGALKKRRHASRCRICETIRGRLLIRRLTSQEFPPRAM
jgi:carboxyl-terminal processing protease